MTSTAMDYMSQEYFSTIGKLGGQSKSKKKVAAATSSLEKARSVKSAKALKDWEALTNLMREGMTLGQAAKALGIKAPNAHYLRNRYSTI